MTNYENIMTMSIEDMATLLTAVFASCLEDPDADTIRAAREEYLRYLRQEVGECI